MVQGDPRGSVPPVYQPSDAQVPKATVIRAISVDPQGKESAVLTKTYFIGNNLGNTRVISLVSDPDGLVSEETGIMVRGASANRWSEDGPMYNFRQKGEAWERAAYLELFEGNNTSRQVTLSTGVGIRVRGGWSRGVGQKSFSVYFRDTYGINNYKGQLIPGAVTHDGKPVATTKGFMLRNGANDVEYTKFYDVFLQELVNDRNFTTQAAVPCILYLNGEYWGPYNMQERYSDNHTEYKYGVKKENVISYDNGELDDGTETDMVYVDEFIGMSEKDFSVSSNYTDFCNKVDINSFIDFWAAEIYIYNEDWPQNNYRLVRTRNVEPGNFYGDTKWRYQMFDVEFASGIYNGGSTKRYVESLGREFNALERILDGENKEHFHNKLFKALIQNEDFCKQFVNTIMDLSNVNFSPGKWQPKLNNYINIYEPLMKATNNGYFSRWGYPGEGSWTTVFENKVYDTRRFLTDIREDMTRYYLPETFNGTTAALTITESDLCDVTLAAAGAAGASIKVNTVTPNISGGWTGKYYKGIPITLTASPAGDNNFEWKVTGGTIISGTIKSRTITVELTGNAVIIAQYQPGASVEFVKLDLAAALATAATGSVPEWGLFAALGGSVPIRANGNNAEVKYSIISENGIKKLKVENYQNGAPGFTIEGPDEYNDVNGTGITFEVGDIIEVKGRFDNINKSPNYFVFNIANWGWDNLQNWGTGYGEINHTFDPLNSTDVGKLVNWETNEEEYRGNIRVSTGGLDPWNFNNSTPISTFVIEQIKIYKLLD
jgi:hypothetical protein